MSKNASNLGGVNILLGVTGGIAAYKAVDLASRLTAAGANIKTVMTENACYLIGPKSFEAVTNSAVFSSLWISPAEYKISHINLAEWAQIVVVAPATANIIAKAATGICDDLLSTVLCTCWQKPVLMAPAMNDNMWTNPAVQQNMKILTGRGVEVTGPEQGRLACGTEAVGRMSKPNDILEHIKQIASKIKC